MDKIQGIYKNTNLKDIVRNPISFSSWVVHLMESAISAKAIMLITGRKSTLRNLKKETIIHHIYKSVRKAHSFRGGMDSTFIL